MKAVVYNKKAVPGKLVYCDVDIPVPADNEVLVKVHAASLNAADCRSMKLGIIPKRKIFGADVAGTVELTGKLVTRFKPGEEVIGDLASFGFGTLAEYTTAPERALVLKPSRFSFEEAASLPLAGMTALQALVKKGKIRQGQKVLVVGSAGGVGVFSVQLARHFGTEVTGVCGPKNVQQTLALGAVRAIDYTKEDFTKLSARYDLILAVNGNYPLTAYRKMLAHGGRYVMVGGSLAQIFKSLLFGRILSIGSKKMLSLSAKPDQADLELLAQLAQNGVLKPVIDRRYPLSQAAEAMKYFSQGHASGKVVIVVGG